ncbi:hypothetical protein HDA40_008044 [Hamadaea flava]|uniref:ABC-2 type transport system permease protein n=1 Tax=Hamadaea flava TaxID=1742688 RepID=A0ABV8LLC3_9ACTN|nr:hypothetical protein [Hamadaea flava]MCP2329537.1 hypothetical protein [Hamadaea flava]
MNTPNPPGRVDDVDLDRVWISVAGEVWRRRRGRAELGLAKLLRSPGLARALLATPSLLPGWLIATAIVLAVGAFAARETGTPYVALCAPAVAAAGIAYTYGPGADPAWELIRTVAVSDRMILLARASAVFGVNAVLGLAASVASGAAAVVTFGWLLPMTAVCAVALATATLARSAAVGLAAGMTGWFVTVAAQRMSSGRIAAAVTESALTVPYLIVVVGCVAAIGYATRAQGRVG